MKTHQAFTRGLGVLALLVLALGLAVSPSAALGSGPGGAAVPQDTGPQGVGGPVPGGPGYVILNAFDFKPLISTASYEYADAALKNPSQFDVLSVVAPVHLPHGATINQVVAYYLDNDPDFQRDVEVELKLCYDLGTICGLMGTIKSSGAVVGVTYKVTSAITTPVVNNASNSYLVEVTLPPSIALGLVAVRVDYTYQTTLPLVKK